MNLDFLGFTVQPGLLIIDVPVYSSVLVMMGRLWIVVFLVRFVASILKLIPFL